MCVSNGSWSPTRIKNREFQMCFAHDWHVAEVHFDLNRGGGGGDSALVNVDRDVDNVEADGDYWS